MFDNVLVGVDGDEGGRDALALAKLLVAERGRLMLGNVYPDEPFVWLGGNPTYQAAELDDSQALLEQAREQAGVNADLRSFGSPSIGKGLHVLAEDTGADLLVVGASRRAHIGRVMLRDDTRAALNGAPCSMAIAPAGYADESAALRTIGVGYDGSPESAHALEVARELAARYGAKLSAFTAVTVPTYVEHGRTAPDGTPFEELVQQARDRLTALGDVEAHAAYGDAAEELALYSASVDLLVVGSRDYGPLGRLVHGSTSQQLTRSARCPLLVLTRAARKAEPDESVEDGTGAAALGA